MIDGREYDTDTMSEEARTQLAMLQLAEAEIKRLDVQLAICKTARATYARALIDAFPLLGMAGADDMNFNNL
jgi:hypothetical protein